MIDSSGRSEIHANGTILDLMPVGRVIWMTGALLVLLFTLVKPEASNGLGLAGRALFWFMHVGLGLVSICLASRWLASRQLLPAETLLAILTSGCGGIVIAACGYLLLDGIYAPYIVDLDPDPPAGSLPTRLVVEVMELAPWFMTAWLLLNLPVLLPRPAPEVSMDDSVQAISSRTAASPEVSNENLAHSALVPENPKPIASMDEPAPGSGETTVVETDSQFLLSLPGVIGTDIIAVSSDLHYLNVWTPAGRTTVLGNLRDVVDDLGDVGMQVHRSHWVAHAHVRRIVGSTNSAACILSNELRIPVSRRRWKAVRDHYGRGVLHLNEQEVR